MRALLVMAIYGMGTLMGIHGFVWAACLFLWSDIFRPLVFARNPEMFPVAWYVAIVLVGTFVYHVWKGNIKPRGGAYLWAHVIFFGWMLITIFLSNFKEVAWPEFILYMKYLVPLFMIYQSLKSRDEVKKVAGVLAVSVGIWGAQAGAHCLVHGVNIDLGIPGGQMTDRNDFTAALVGTIPMLIYWGFSYDWRFKIPVRLGYLAMVALCISAIIFSLSRGASLGLVATACFYLSFVSKHRVRDFAAVAVLGIVGFQFLPQEWFERMDTIQVGGDQQEESANIRMQLWMAAFQVIRDYPIFGVGPEGWLEVVKFYGDFHAYPHSIWLKICTELGIPGLLLYLGVIGLTFWRTREAILLAGRMKDKDAVRLGMALITCVVGLVTAMTFLNRPFNEYLWAWLALCNAWASIYPEEVALRIRGLKAGQAAREAKMPAAPEVGGSGTLSSP